MPLFVTVTPGTTVSSTTTLSASTLNLLGTPSINITGSVDGGTLSVADGSLTLAKFSPISGSRLIGNGSAVSAYPAELSSTDLAFTSSTVNIGTGAVVEAKIGARAVSAGKLFAVDGTSGAKLLGRYTASSGDIETLTLGSNLTVTGGALNTLRPAVASTTVLNISGYTVPTTRATPQEITALTTSITTQQAASKVLVSFNISYSISALGADSCKYAFILTRTVGGVETELSIPSSPQSNQVYGIKPVSMSFYNYQQVFDSIQFLDSPGSAAAVTYKLKIYGSVAISSTPTTGFFLNRSSGDADVNYSTRGTSQVILQEILV